MSIEVGTQLKNNLAGIISLSGRVYTEIFSKENRIKSKLLIIHGDRDEIIKPMANVLAKVYKNVTRCNSCGSLMSNSSGCINCENIKEKF